MPVLGSVIRESMVFRWPAKPGRFRPVPARSGRLRLHEGAEGLGQRRTAPVTVGGDVEGARDLEIAKRRHETSPLRHSSSTARTEITDTPTPALTACLMAWVEPISPTIRNAARSRPAWASADSSAARVPDPRSRSSNGSRAEIGEPDFLLAVPRVADRHDEHQLVGHQLAKLDTAMGQLRADHSPPRRDLPPPSPRPRGCRRSGA